MTGKELQKELDDYCEEMRSAMPGLLYLGILSCADGTTLSKSSNNGDVAKFVEQESASHLLIVNQVKKVADTNETAGKLEVQFILIETDKITFMFSISPEGKYFALLVLDREKANLAISRTLLYRGKDKLGRLLDSFF